MKPHKEKKVQDPNWLYQFLRHYVDASMFQAYRDIEYIGLEKIPQDAAVIYAPNHCNALMDALIILALDKKPKVFVARADIFRNPLLAKILKFLKIMPIMRIRDGVDEVKKNQEIIDKSVDVLMDGIPFCILPEGTHRAQHALLPLSKGIFRIALQAQAALQDKKEVCIVPVGIEYGNYFRFRSTVRVQVGDPINIHQYLATHPNQQTPEVVNELRQQLTKAMRQLILYLPADEQYDACYELTAIVSESTQQQIRATTPSVSPLERRVLANQQTAERLMNLKETRPEDLENLLQACQQVHQERLRHKISLASIVPRCPWRKRGATYLLNLIASPYLLFCLLGITPLAAISALILRLMKDEAFHNSVRFVLQLVLWPILMLVYGIVAFLNLPWEWALLLFTILSPAPIFAQDFFRNLRLFVSDCKWSANRPLRQSIRKIREQYFRLIHPQKSTL